MSLSAFGLNLLIFLPLVGAILVWRTPREREDVAGRLALWISIACLLVAAPLWYQSLSAGAGTIAEVKRAWIEVGGRSKGELIDGLRISWHVALDALSAPLMLLTAILVPLSVACSFTAIRHRVNEYYAWLLMLTSGMFGVFAARDLLLFYVFFEFTLIPLYFLIGIWGGSDRRYAANKFFLFTFAGSVLTFAGILYLAIRGAQLSGSGVVDFDLVRLSSLALGGAGLTAGEQSLLFLAFFAGFAIKVPLFPLHTWLPLAHTEAPTAGSVLLAGVLLKLGTYGFLRFSLPMVPSGAMEWASLMGVLAVMGIIYGALCSWVQQDVKKLVAYSSVSHLGFCMLGMFSLVDYGISGSVLYMINHGLSTGALFLCVGMMYERYHTRDMRKLGGLAKEMPIFAFFLVVFVLSSVGLPGLNGFVSEFTTLMAAFNSPLVLGPWFGVFGATGILLGAIYLFYMTGSVLFGPYKAPADTPDLSAGLSKDLNRREIAILTPLAVLCVILGWAPRLVTDTLDPLIQAQVLNRVAAARQVNEAMAATPTQAATLAAISNAGAAR
ncbi:MAG: NADH-quinone oxidoreductase subunit M [Phycisphaerae bacterium]|nr:NADH-quinone oxidoreductase subunit M [Phycisphaerae bacterium]